MQRWYPDRISYGTGGLTKTVTATALPAVPTASPEEPQLPTIAGTPTEGQTLSETHGAWTNGPTSYSYQWQRCDSAGNNCQPIAGATPQSYSQTVADVRSAIRVQEVASNSEGSGSPATSAATAVVQAGTAGGSSGGGTGGNGGGTPTVDGGDGPITNPGLVTATISSAQIKALLAKSAHPVTQDQDWLPARSMAAW